MKWGQLPALTQTMATIVTPKATPKQECECAFVCIQSKDRACAFYRSSPMFFKVMSAFENCVVTPLPKQLNVMKTTVRNCGIPLRHLTVRNPCISQNDCKLVGAMLFHHHNTNCWCCTTIDKYFSNVMRATEWLSNGLFHIHPRIFFYWDGDNYHPCKNMNKHIVCLPKKVSEKEHMICRGKKKHSFINWIAVSSSNSIN